MFIETVDIQDGKGPIQVVVADWIQVLRLRKFFTDAFRLYEETELKCQPEQ